MLNKGGFVLLAPQRQKEIYRLMMENGEVQLSDLAKRFEVSVMTIHRDIEKLEKVGRARRVHGGAVIPQQHWTPEPFKKKISSNIELKEAIAKTVVPMFKPNTTVFLDAGSTALEIAKVLQANYTDNLTICTPDVHIAMTLYENHRFNVLILGGVVENQNGSITSHFALDMLKKLHADVAFIGCDGVTVQDGAMAANFPQIPIKQMMLERSMKSVLVTDSTKIGRISVTSIAPIAAFDFIATDQHVSNEFAEFVRNSGCKLILPNEEDDQI